MMYFNKEVGAHKNKKRAHFIFSNFPPTFDMLCLNVFPQQKCKKKKNKKKKKKKNICVAICFGFLHNLTGLSSQFC